MSEDSKRIVRRGYDRMANRYASWSRAIQDEPRGRLIDEFVKNLGDRARVLDLGCGSGIPSTQALARRYRLVGVDASQAQIKRARRNVPQAEFIHSDFMELDLPTASFEGVVALYSVSHVPRDEHAALFAKVHQWLVPGGLFLATLGAEDSPDWTGTWLGEQMFFSSHGADTNRNLLRAAGFDLDHDEIAVTREPERDVPFLWVIARSRGEGIG